MLSTTEAGATATYTVSFKYTSQVAVGSLDMLFCVDPIPQDPCVPPTGLDVSHAVISSQSGETGFHIASQNSNHILLARPSPAVVGNEQSSYSLSGIVNPTYMDHSFSIRLSDYASTDGSGPLIDLGSVVTQITNSIFIDTQVPPILIFCMAQVVAMDCSSVDGGNYSDLGTLDPNNTLDAQSQMAVGTNASQGFVITANGTTMAAGTHVIDAPVTPTASVPGVNEFGINLVANSSPNIGHDPEGPSLNAVVSPNYAQADKFMYKDGDVVASSPNVSLMRRFTTSYVVNSNPDLRAGVYTTTITYICTGRF